MKKKTYQIPSMMIVAVKPHVLQQTSSELPTDPGEEGKAGRCNAGKALAQTRRREK